MRPLTMLLLVTAAAATTYGFDEIPNDQSSWTKLISFLMATTSQNAEPKTGICGDHCYVVNGAEKVALKQGGKYVTTDQPCNEYICTNKGVNKITRQCPNPNDCAEGTRLVRLPEQCCAACEGPSPPTDVFTDWGKWTECSKSCGRGAQARRRECKIAENGQTVDCVGRTVEVQDCNAKPCSIPCVWQPWSEWSCSVTCGGGTEVRTREPIPSEYNRRNCEESGKQETRHCERGKCPDESCPSGQNLCDQGCIPDKDHDCHADNKDNCPEKHNTEQLDDDADGRGNSCDNCEHDYNPDQSDNDKDERGDVCDDDDDNDGIYDRFDNCDFIANPRQSLDDPLKYGDSCKTPNNGVVIMEDNRGMSPDGKKGLVAEIMEKMLEMYYSN